jgi:hypothetical protein
VSADKDKDAPPLLLRAEAEPHDGPPSSVLRRSPGAVRGRGGGGVCARAAKRCCVGRAAGSAARRAPGEAPPADAGRAGVVGRAGVGAAAASLRALSEAAGAPGWTHPARPTAGAGERAGALVGRTAVERSRWCCASASVRSLSSCLARGGGAAGRAGRGCDSRWKTGACCDGEGRVGAVRNAARGSCSRVGVP